LRIIVYADGYVIIYVYTRKERGEKEGEDEKIKDDINIIT